MKRVIAFGLVALALRLVADPYAALITPIAERTAAADTQGDSQ